MGRPPCSPPSTKVVEARGGSRAAPAEERARSSGGSGRWGEWWPDRSRPRPAAAWPPDRRARAAPGGEKARLLK